MKETLIRLNIVRIKTAAFILLAKKKDITVFTVLLKKLNDFFNKEKQYKARLIYVIVKLLNKEVNPIIVSESEYYEFLSLFLR